MTKDTALRLALEVLEKINFDTGNPDAQDAIKPIKAALEAKDEPVATKNNDGVTLHLGWDDLPVGTKLYATPPQRKPMTDEELRNHYQSNEWLDGVRFAEQFHGIKGEA